MRELLHDPLACWLALWLTPGVGPRSWQRLLAAGRQPRELLANPRSGAGLLREAATGHLRHPDWNQVRLHLRWAQTPGNHLLTLHDHRYPPLLAQIPDPPPLLLLSGDVDVLRQAQLALVGSRNPSSYGREHAQRLARQLAEAGYAITSGLALGIDTAAHRGALQASNGRTIAVLGSGLQRLYPQANQALAADIAQRGALVSELPLHAAPHPGHFPRRNRIISGLAAGTVVIQASLRSGSLITAQLAAEQGREVFALPGPVHDTKSQGCHRLIREGATLVESGADILAELNPLTGIRNQAAPAATDPAAFNPRVDRGLDPLQSRVLENLSSLPASIDELIDRCGLTPEAVSSILLVLELQGLVTALDGRYSKPQ